jgi:hypothetical protein
VRRLGGVGPIKKFLFLALMFCCKRKKSDVCSIECKAHDKVYIIMYNGKMTKRRKQLLGDVQK